MRAVFEGRSFLSFSKRFCQRELSDRSSAYARERQKVLTLTLTKHALEPVWLIGWSLAHLPVEDPKRGAMGVVKRDELTDQAWDLMPLLPENG
jgi:hypothetical protein